jgi:Ca-activated chloride channel family protein
MEQLADRGNGNYAYLDSAREAQKVLVEEAGATLHAIAKDVKIQVEFDPDRVKSHRLIGYENRVLAHEDFDDDTKDAGEIGSGHTVTALYEVETIDGDAPLMTLDLRYKRPDEDTSTKIAFTVQDDGRGLGGTSDDYRFSAAVAAFAQKLRGADAEQRTSFAEILALAQGAIGDDPYCHRHEFLDLVWRAADLSQESFDRPDTRCQTQRVEPQPIAVPMRAGENEPFDWGAFVLEVVRLVPPLAALPLFVLAFRRRRRCRE